MEADEYNQQQLEQQEQEETSVRIQDEYGNLLGLHIWGDDDTVFVNINSNAIHFSVHLTVEQADIMVNLLNNALRRAK